MKVSAHYDARKNETKIQKKLKGKDDDLDNEDKDETKEILPGLVIINFTTNKGVVDLNY